MNLHRWCAALALLVLLALSAAAPAYAQNCTLVGNSQNLNFGNVPANPTMAATTGGMVTVRCTRGLLQLNALKVCVSVEAGPADANNLNPRRMGNGGDTIDYRITSNTPNGALWGSMSGSGSGAVSFTVQWNLFEFSRDVSIPVHGTLFAGQSGLASGVYSSTMSGRIGSSTNTNQACPAMPTDSTFNLTATALVNGSCTLIAEDLDFGRHSRLDVAIDAGTAIGITCTQGAPYTVRLNGGSIAGNVADRRMARNGAGAGVIAYQLYLDAARSQVWGDGSSGSIVATGTGTGSPATLAVYGRVPAQATPVPGTYRDVVTATVEY